MSERIELLVPSTKNSTICYDPLIEYDRQSKNGLIIAELPDIYSVMQWNNDTPQSAAIRERLLDGEQPLLPLDYMSRETREVDELLAMIPNAADDPYYHAARHLATSALCTLYTLYGDPKIGSVNQIVGNLEQPEYGVRAFYHNAFNIKEDAKDLQSQLEVIGASTADRLDALVADLYTDIVYGNGRESDNPEGFDELLSARLLYQHAIRLGYPEQRAKLMYDMVLGTRFDEKTKRQPGRFSDDLRIQAVAGVDLQGLSRPGIVGAIEIAVENLMSRRKSEERVLGKLLQREGVVIRTIHSAIEFIKAHRDTPVISKTAQTLGEAYLHEMQESMMFYRNYQPPVSWKLDSPKQREENAVKIEQHNLNFQKTGEILV